MDKQSVWTETFSIRSYEVDVHYRIQFPVLCNLLQECAWKHARNLRFGYFDLKEQGKLWVLSRIVIELEKLPEWDQRISIDTWPKDVERFFALRDFLVRDGGGAHIASATSFWLLLDARTKRPLKLDQFVRETPIERDIHALKEHYKKINILEDGNSTYSRVVRFSDLDQNNHVNYVQYIRWCLDTYTPEFHSTHSLRRFEINFRAEALLGNTVVVGTTVPEETNDTMTLSHWIERAEDNQRLCNAKTVWRAY